ncbi:MAG TPA: hypothetical protein VFT72_16840 [Opitutaceae bacterium]|nr:hypothetical protein [Opitutaceae bacterium]
MPDAHGEIGRLDAGLHRVQVSQLVYEKPGMRLTLPSATVDVPLIRAAKKDVAIQKLVAKGWILDLTQAQAMVPPQGKSTVTTAHPNAVNEPQKSSAAPERTNANPPSANAGAPTPSFSGVFDLLSLPIDLQVDAAELEGDVLLPGNPGEAPSRAHVVITGGGVGAGKTGHFKIETTTRLAAANSPVSDVTTVSDVTVKMDSPRTFEVLSSTSDVTARGTQFPNGAKMRLTIDAERRADGESYGVHLNSTDTAAGKQLAMIQAAFPKASRVLSGTWTIDARDADLAPFALGLTLPEFSAMGSGKFQTNAAFDEIHASGNFNADIAKLERAYPGIALPDVGVIKTQGEFDLVQNKNLVRIDRFTTSISTDKPLLSVEALQPIEFNTETKAVMVTDGQKDLFRARLNGIPLSYAKSFLPPDLLVKGDDVTGEVVASAQNGAVDVRTLSPLTLGNITIVQAGAPVLEAVTIRAALAGQYSSRGWQADITELTFGSAQSPWLKAALKAGRAAGETQPIKATGQYEVNLAEAGKQPVLKTFAVLSAGKAAGDFTAIITDALKQIASNLQIRDLAAAGVTQPVPTVSANVRADLQADGLIKLQAPIIVQKGDRKSDLDAVAELRSSPEKLAIDAHVRSEALYVEDLQAVAAPFGTSEKAAEPSSTPTAQPTAPSTPNPPPATPPADGGTQKPDTKPFWSSVSGQIQLELKKVVYSADLQAANVTGNLKIGPDALTLENLNAVMGEGSGAKINGGVTFNAKSKEPYTLDADINMANVNPGPILAMLSPTKQPTVEGPFDLVGKFSGEAATVDTIAQSTAAELKLTSRGGKFRGFAASSRATDIAKYQKTASTVGSILNMAGGLLGSNASSNYGDKLIAASDTLKRLLEIDFDQLNLELSHRPGEDLKVTDFSLISPDLRLVSSGSVNTSSVTRWWEKPLHLDVQMAVRGDQAKNLAKLNLLKDVKDPLGYVPLLEKFSIDGTMANLGADALTKLLTRSFATAK